MKHFNWKELVPATKQDAVEKALEHAIGTIEIDDMALLTGGRSSALVYKVTVNHKSYVMRIIMQVDVLSDPVRQFICLKAAAKQNVAPTVRYTNAEDAISIVDFIEHTPLSAWFTSENEMFRELATTIKAIHALPLFPPLVNFLDGVDSLIERSKSLELLPPHVTEEHFRHYSSIQRAYPRNETNLVSSHNDLNPGNILYSGGKLWIVDWEAAFANDCYVDLAVVNIFFGSGERGEETLLKTYFGQSLNDYHRARFFLMRQVCFMYISMLFMHITSLLRQPDSAFNSSMETMRIHDFHCQLRSGEISMASAEQHLLYAKVLLNESLSQMKTPRFSEAISLLESRPL